MVCCRRRLRRLMSTNFEKRIFLPNGKTGHLILPPEHQSRVERWYRREWDQFVTEFQAWKRRFIVARYDCFQCTRARAKLLLSPTEYQKFRLQQMRDFKGPRHQRGMLSGFSIRRALLSAGGDCSYTASTIPNLNDFCINPCTSRVRGRLHTDGDWYWTEGTTSWGASRGTWDGDCAISDYDSRWNTNSGDAPNEGVSGADGVWSDASVTGAAIGLSVGFGPRSGSYDVEIRDGTSLNVLFTDAFTMSVEADAKN